MTPSPHSCVRRVPSLRASTPPLGYWLSLRYLPKGVQGALLCWTPQIPPCLSWGGPWSPPDGAMAPPAPPILWHMGDALCAYTICMHTEVLCLASVFSLKCPIPACCHSLCLDFGDAPRSGLAPFRPSVRPSHYSELSRAPIRTPTAMGWEPSVNVYTGVLESRAGLTPGEGFWSPDGQ